VQEFARDIKSLRSANQNSAIWHVDIECIARTTIDADAEATTLSNRHEFHRVDRTQFGSGFVNQPRWVHFDSVPKEYSASSARMRNETDVLAIRLTGGAETKFGCTFTHFVFGHTSDWQHDSLELCGREHVEHVTLVFCEIGATSQAGKTGRGPHYLGVMTCRNHVEAQGIGPSH
jgi:hypothetical protein